MYECIVRDHTATTAIHIPFDVAQTHSGLLGEGKQIVVESVAALSIGGLLGLEWPAQGDVVGLVAGSDAMNLTPSVPKTGS